MAVCDGSCEPSCSYGCELRKKNLSIAPSATPSRMNTNPPPKANPVWERTIPTQERPDGSRMPFLSPTTGKPMRIREFNENKAKVREARRRQASTD